MPTLKLSLDRETYDALYQAASSHLRPPDWHAQALLRQALGLPFPIPAQDEPKATMEALYDPAACV
jgi:hypothetical protein